MSQVVNLITTCNRRRAMSRACGHRILTAAILAGVLGGAGAVWAQGGGEARAAEKTKKNPVAGGAKAVEAGKKVAQVNCVLCHGGTGKGNGPGSAALKPNTPEWPSKRVQDESDGEIFWKISNGRGPMPSWKHLPETDRWSVVHYIRTLQDKYAG